MLQGLQFAHYQFSLVCTSKVQFDQFAGATLRSAVGSALYDLEHPSYDYLYDTSPHKDRNTSHEDVPRPYIIAPLNPNQCHYHPGEELRFDLTLVGKAIDYLHHFIESFLVLEQPDRGLGTDRNEKGRFYLSRVMAIGADDSRYIVFDRASGDFYDAAAAITAEEILRRAGEMPTRRVRVRFLTPTHIVKGGRRLATLQFHQFHKTVSWRIRSLMRRHCDRHVDFRQWIEPAYDILTTNLTLDEVSLPRYSSTQKKKYTIEGFTGTVTFEGDLEPFLPFLAAGEWLHVGKGYVMGLGKYRVERASSLSSKAQKPKAREPGSPAAYG